MSATPDPATPSLEPSGVPEPPSGDLSPASTRDLPDTCERLPGLEQHRLAPLWLAPPQLPPWPVVWLALEGGPEGGQGHRSTRLWGLAVDDGRGEPTPEAITADFDDQADRRGWERFVTRASEIIERYPEARWVHYSACERNRVRHYTDRHGAPPGFLERLEEAFFELLSRGVQRAVRLPFDSCSLRQVAGLAGFRWRSSRPGPTGSIGQYQKARASIDPVERTRILREIADSNAEELLAMRAVWRWMLEQGPREYCG
jgi:predicted RecB family nuclease